MSNITGKSIKQCLDETIDDLLRERDEIVEDRYRIQVELEEAKKKIIELERNRNNQLSEEVERITEQDEITNIGILQGKNNMEPQSKNEACGKNGKNNEIFIKEHAENTDFGGESVSYEKILAENSTLRKRVVRVKELMRVIKKMEVERVKLKDEIKNLNDDVINSLVAERDEITESKFLYMDKLKESKNLRRRLRRWKKNELNLKTKSKT